MAGIILNVTELKSNANHMRNRRNDVGGVLGEIIVENIDEKRHENHINDAVNTVITNDINSNRDSANELNYTKTAATDEEAKHRTSTSESAGSSNNRSITFSHHQNNGYDDSSVFDSSSDADSDFDDIVPSTSGITMMDQNLNSQNGHPSITCANNYIKPNIGSIAIQNSTDITFGNKTYFQGPITIKQFVIGGHNLSSSPESDNLENMDENDEKDKKWKCTRRRSLCCFIFIGILACLLLAVILIVKLSSKTSSQNESDDIVTDTPGVPRIVTRKEWLAQAPTGELEPLELPVSRVIIAHTVSQNCSTQALCSDQVKNIQSRHIELEYDDIGYNFLAGGDGAIYVGRGWNKIGAHTIGYNTDSIGFAFIGTFNTIKPPQHQLVAVQKMLVEGVKLKKLKPDYALYGQRQLQETQSPGQALYEIIQKWDHWKKDTK